jgi:hypothetical protein
MRVSAVWFCMPATPPWLTLVPWRADGCVQLKHGSAALFRELELTCWRAIVQPANAVVLVTRLEDVGAPIFLEHAPVDFHAVGSIVGQAPAARARSGYVAPST